MKKTDISFDQYQRYETLSRLIEYHRKTSAQRFVILELGANEHKDLALFMPKDHILFTNIVLTSAMEADPDFQMADGTDLPFEDGSFDFVVAADVFEHVPPEKRTQFLSEAYRVARIGVLLSFPHDSPDVIDAENRVNEYYRAFTGEDFIWLKEHQENSLPVLEEVDKCLDKLVCSYFSFFHGDIRVWEKLWYSNFDALFSPNTQGFHQDIYRYYNTNIYLSDVSDNCYRVFFVISKTDDKGWKKYSDAMWKKTGNAEATTFLDSLTDAQRDLHVLCKIKGLNETINDQDHYIQNLTHIIEDKEQHIQKLNAYIAETEKQTAKELRDWSEAVDAKEQRIQKLNTEKEELSNELSTCQQHYLVASSQRDELTKQLSSVQNAYNVISEAACWKMTKPLRVTLDVSKRVLKSNQYTYLFCRGLKCLRENGVRYTWRRLQERARENTNGAEVQYDTVPASAAYQVPETIKFSIAVPLYNTPNGFLREMIQSVLDQTYGNWELCMADGSDEAHSYVGKICEEYAGRETRIKYRRLGENRGISDNTNACIAMAAGDYIALLGHDDVLAPDALEANAAAIMETEADILYSDEDHITADGRHVYPIYKPDWSPDLLYSQMYICHLLVFRRELFESIGGFRAKYDGSQDYDLMLRLSEQTNKICHIPRLLYSWRESGSSTAANPAAKPYAHEASLRALDEHLKRKYGQDAYAEETEYLFVYNPRFACGHPFISIIIPFKDCWEMTDDCVRSILQNRTYLDYEILLLNNRSEKQDTAAWAERIQREDKRVCVIDADMEFNWSKLNNFGVSRAKGDVYVFLNNDTKVISGDWLERLSENALRPDTGAVGALLLYPDDTIQHAGVVVGIGGWADHIFKGVKTEHGGSPYVSPMVSRNVLAVTGACMAISRQTMKRVGGFDEEFIICGSDVEWCIRAYESGLQNRYDANVRLYHYESKSRDSYIPEIDFQKSAIAYAPYWENGDPYFNVNLDITSVVPKESVSPVKLISFVNYLKKNPLAVKTYHALKRALMSSSGFEVPEISPLNARRGEGNELRLNLLTPSVDQRDVFGGIATALRFFEVLRKTCRCEARIIVTDGVVKEQTSVPLDGYMYCSCEQDSSADLQVIPMKDRYGRTIPVRRNDVFVATAWWTAYVVSDVIRWQSKIYDEEQKPLIYMVQDYEPGFYPWSSRYMLAESTYHMEIPIFAVINSGILAEYFRQNGYFFARSWQFDPVLNDSLRRYLPERGSRIMKKKQILVYGRPSVSRNAFELLIYALKRWRERQKDAGTWTVLSAGEQHDDVDLGGGMVLKSVGKLPLDEYAKLLLDTYAGVSLMVSPHPSYPPLEMAAFGARTITNCYANKDLASFSKNIISLRACDPADIADALCTVCDSYSGEGRVDAYESYLTGGTVYEDIAKEIAENLTEVFSHQKGRVIEQGEA